MKTTRSNQPATFINEARIFATLSAAQGREAGQVREILAKAREMEGLNAADMAALMEPMTRSCWRRCSPPPGM